jgi:hypothetical protein
MFNTIDYIKGIIEGLTFTQKISNIIPGTTETTFETCKTYWIFPKSIITINGLDYKVLDFEINESVTIRGILTGTETDFTIKAPNFFRGTPMQTSNALMMIKDWKKKLPMAYLIQPMNETRSLTTLERIGITAEGVRILFMLPGKLADSIDQQYLTAIQPTDNLIFEYEKALMTDPNIGELGNATKSDRPNYGVWVSRNSKTKPSNQDNVKKLIDEDISGVEYIIDIPFKRQICDIDATCKN